MRWLANMYWVSNNAMMGVLVRASPGGNVRKFFCMHKSWVPYVEVVDGSDNKCTRFQDVTVCVSNITRTKFSQEDHEIDTLTALTLSQLHLQWENQACSKTWDVRRWGSLWSDLQPASHKHWTENLNRTLCEQDPEIEIILPFASHEAIHVIAWLSPPMSTGLFCEPMSPLTAAPDSSPFPTPCRKLAGRRFNKRGIRREFLTSSGSHKPKIIQTPHWHLSDAKRQSTGYRGLNELDPTRIIFPEESTPEERLEMLKEAGYRIVEFEECVHEFCV